MARFNLPWKIMSRLYIHIETNSKYMSDPLLLVIAFGYILLSIDKTIKVFTKRKGKSRTMSQYVIAFIMILSFTLLSASYFADSIHYTTFDVENIGKYGHLGLFTHYVLKLANGPFYLGNLLDVLGHYLFFFRFVLKNTPFVNASGTIFLFVSFLIPCVRNINNVFTLKYFADFILCLGYLFITIYTIQNVHNSVSSNHSVYHIR